MPELILAAEFLVRARRRNSRRSRLAHHRTPAHRRQMQRSHFRPRARGILHHAIHALRRGLAFLRIANRTPHRAILRRLFPRHVVSLPRRPQVLRGIAMAVQTPLHLQRVLRIHQRHLVHTPVARRAAQPLVHVNLMAEINKVRQIVHLGPHKRLPARPTRPHRLQQLRVRPDLRVAVDARLGRRNPRVARLLHRRVTVLALQTQSLHVVLMAERHRLIRPLPLAGHPGRALQLVQRDPQGNHDQPRQYKAHASQSIGAAVKYLRHEYFP